MTTIRSALFATAAVIGLTVAAMPANAALIEVGPINFNTGNIPAGDTSNVLFNQPGQLDNASLVTGNLNSASGTLVNISTSVGTLTTPSGGQARVAGLSPTTYSDLTIELVSSTFTGITFNINVANPTGGPPDEGDVRITVYYTPPAGSEAFADFEVASNGQNFFTITADAGFEITKVKYVLTDVVATDTRQIRITETGAEVPVPGLLGLLGAGLVGLGIAARRRRK